MVNLVGVFCGTNDQRRLLGVLLGFEVWGSKKLFLGVLTKIKISEVPNYKRFRTKKKNLSMMNKISLKTIDYE